MNDEIERLKLELAAYKRYSQGLSTRLEKESYTIVMPVLRYIAKFVLYVLSFFPTSWMLKAVKIKSYFFNKRILPHHGDPATKVINYIDLFEVETDQKKDSFISLFCKSSSREYDVLMFPIIDWEFRFQRPQHLAKQFSLKGNRVIYISPQFTQNEKPGFEIYSAPEGNIFLCKLFINKTSVDIHGDEVDKSTLLFIRKSLVDLQEQLNIGNSVSLIQHPFWHQVCFALVNSRITYDCLDFHQGFSTKNVSLASLEEKLLTDCDHVVTTSQFLFEQVSDIRKDVRLIRNAADVDHFMNIPVRARNEKEVIIGYIGAISDWFDIELVISCAKSFPDWKFVMVGSTFGCDIKLASKLDNLFFEGEVEYQNLPSYLDSFDVCIIPFKKNQLTLCTNPVKVYEYLAAGKAVVSTDLPEIQLLSDIVYSCSDTKAFELSIKDAVKNRNNKELSYKRRDWALTQSWKQRCDEFSKVFYELPKISIVVLSYNNFNYTQACLLSISKYTLYSNYEIILVDNNSTKETIDQLKVLVSKISYITLIINTENLGFAGGNNVGIKAAEGDYIVLLNNDTYVSDGWLNRLVHHLKVNDDIGLVGPVTNNIGNEAKIPLEYDDIDKGLELAKVYTLKHSNQLFRTNNIAFFCVAIPREVIQKVGLLDENFGRGFFEDDDYCKRVKETGYKIAIADDVFVHHHLSASFDQVNYKEREALFIQNKAYYENKWGQWKPHKTVREECN